MNFNDCLINTDSGEVLYHASLVMKKLGYKNVSQTLSKYCPEAREKDIEIVDKKGSARRVSAFTLTHDQLQKLVDAASKNFTRGKVMSLSELKSKIESINEKIAQLNELKDGFNDNKLQDILESHHVELDELEASYQLDLKELDNEIEAMVAAKKDQIIKIAEAKLQAVIATAEAKARISVNPDKIKERLNKSYELKKARIERAHEYELKTIGSTESIDDEIYKLNVMKREILLRNGYGE